MFLQAVKVSQCDRLMGKQDFMAASDNTTDGPQHVLADWLALHQISVAQCRKVISQPLPSFWVTETVRSQTATLSYSGLQAWGLARDALICRFPMAQDHIAQTHDTVQLLLAPDPKTFPRALTLKDGGKGVPLVLCNFQGRARDVLTLAHEFGHATQIMACDAGFVPPVTRELCAFLSELALLEYLKRSKSECFPQLVSVWHRAALATWRKDRLVLLHALDNLATPYDYAWNYPMARTLALHLHSRDNAVQNWGLFQGKMSLLAVVQGLVVAT